MPRITRLLADLSPLRESPAFRRLWAGSVASATGSALTRFAVTLQVYDISRSSFAVGIVSLCQLVPILVIGLIGGSLADAVDRRKLVIVTNCLLVGVSAALAGQAIVGLRSLWLLYLLVTIQACISSVAHRPGRPLSPACCQPTSSRPASRSTGSTISSC